MPPHRFLVEVASDEEFPFPRYVDRTPELGRIVEEPNREGDQRSKDRVSHRRVIQKLSENDRS